MWPFSAGTKKPETRGRDVAPLHSSVVPETGAKSLQNYLEYKREDVNLQLSPDRVRTLKKILYYHSTLSTTKRDYDIFAVSWDVNNLPEPPDDISPLLPPDAWGEPDMIAIGIQRCPATAAPLWSVIVAHSVHRYSPLFKPVSTEAPFDERSGNLIVLFMRQDLLQFVSGYSSKLVGASPANAAALRFSFHQSSIAFVCAKLMDTHSEGFTIVDPLAGMQADDVDQLSEDDLKRLQRRMASEALLRQKFASMANNLQFDVDGKIFTINEHPIIVWMGLKDYNQKSLREEKMANSIFLNSKRNVTSIPSTLDPTNPFAALENHSFDIRAVKKVLMGPPSCHQFGTYVNLLCRTTKGRVDILKAGVMRLVLELLDDSGVPTPSEAAPELVFLRATVPAVDANQLRDLYLKSWRILRNAHTQELPQIRLEPNILRIPRPLAPWVPYTFSFKIVNTSKSKLPAPFTIFCVSDSGSFVLPLGRHSFLHQSKAVSRQRKRMPVSGGRPVSVDVNSARSSVQPCLPVPAEPKYNKNRDLELIPTSPGVTPLLAADIQKKVGALRRLAGRNLGHSWLVRTARGSNKPPAATRGDKLAPSLGYDKLLVPASTAVPRSSTIQSKNSIGRSSKSLLSGFLPPKYKKSKSAKESTSYASPETTAPAKDRKFSTPEQVLESNKSTAEVDEPITVTPATTVPQSPRIAERNKVITAVPEQPSQTAEFTLTKWMLVEPLEGVVLHGKDVEIQVTILIQEGFLETLEIPYPVTLVVRVDDCNRDFFLGLEVPQVTAALDGLGPNQLQELASQPLQTSTLEAQTATTEEQPSADRQRTYFASASPPTARRRSLLSPLRIQTPQTATLPMPKEIWHLLSFVHHRIIYELDASSPLLPQSWSASDEPGTWFCFPLFLQRASRGWETTTPRVRQDLGIVRQCVERHQQIPSTVSVEAALRTLERWAMSLPVPLVPREYITDISTDDDKTGDINHVHFVCRAVLLSLPMVARNILLSLTALIRELLMFHQLTAKAMMRPLIDATVSAPTTPCPSLKSVLSDDERAAVLHNITEASNWKPGSDEETHTLVAAVTEWVARFITRDTPVALSLPFIRHFIKTA